MRTIRLTVLSFLALLTGFISTTSFATPILPPAIKYASYYLNSNWPGEYPDGYELLEEMTVYGYEDLNLLGNPQSCTLPKGAVIHPWAKKRQIEFAYFSPVSEFIVTQDYKVGVNDEIELEAGDRIYELAYLSEGICILLVKGREIESSCLDDYMSEVDLAVASPFKARRLFKTRCEEGHSLWIDTTELEFYLNNGVKYADIIGYDAVAE